MSEEEDPVGVGVRFGFDVAEGLEVDVAFGVEVGFNIGAAFGVANSRFFDSDGDEIFFGEVADKFDVWSGVALEAVIHAELAESLHHEKDGELAFFFGFGDDGSDSLAVADDMAINDIVIGADFAGSLLHFDGQGFGFAVAGDGDFV